MTDVLERDDVRPIAPEVPKAVRAPAGVELPSDVRLLLAAASAGAGAIHLAMVPSHWGESVAEGLGFATAGWLQLAFAVAVWSRPSRLLLRFGVLLNFVAIAAWAVSRTAGLPFGAHSGHAESAGFVDVTCVAFEALLVLGCAAVLLRPRTRARSGRGGIAIAAIAAVSVLALTTGALASPSARDHAAGSHGDTAAAGGGGHSHGDAASGGDDKGLSLLHNGQHHDMTVHTLDDSTQKALDAQLAVTRELARQTPTVEAALAAGYRRVGPYFPGIGAHYMKDISRTAMNPDGVIDDADLRNPLMLIFDGTKSASKIAGFMYYSMASSEPPGFAGRNDYWHFHEQLCLKYTSEGIDVPYGLDNSATEKQCNQVGGRMLRASQYMVHVWPVPGFEMTAEYGGVFGEVNPKLTCADGTYYQLPIEQWASHPLNVCKAQ